MGKVMVLFGSGGHSTEMLMLMQNAKLGKKLATNSVEKLVCVVSQDDSLICDKIDNEFPGITSKGKVERVKLSRGREIGQSYLTTFWTFLISLYQSIQIISTHKPAVCLTNGPAISVTISLAIFILNKTLNRNYKCRIMYVESFCRTRTLSLSGRLIYHLKLADEFYVQWPRLSVLYTGVKYKGLLV